MRVLSFIPAFLLAVTSFAVAAPTTPVTSCVLSAGGSSGGNGVSLQVFMNILTNATTEIKPLSDELTSSKEGTPDVNTISDIIVKINSVVSETVTELKAEAQVDLSGVNLTDICATIYALLTLILSVLDTLIAIVTILGVNAVGTLQTVIINLLNAVTDLVGCLQVFVVAGTSGVLGPVLLFVCGAVDLLLAVTHGLSVLVGTTH